MEIRPCIICGKPFYGKQQRTTMCSIKCRNKKTNRAARGWPISDKDQGPQVRKA
jgi:hypothetical protein